MVLNSPLVVRVANVSANICQNISCNPERLSSDQVLDLICCLPFQQLRRLALSIWTFFCFPPPSPDFSYYLSDSSSSSSYYDSHSD